MTKTIPATPVEFSKLSQRIAAANDAKIASDHATAVVADLFTMFCEAHGVSGATLVGVKDGHVIVTVPEPEAPKPELVA